MRVATRVQRAELAGEIRIARVEAPQQPFIQRGLAGTGGESGLAIDAGQVERAVCAGDGHRGTGGRFAGARLYPAREGQEHRCRVDGLGDVVVHAGGQRQFAVAGHVVGGHGDDRQLRQLRTQA